jgi:ribosomal-protein-alanine N-acetyltransferase
MSAVLEPRLHLRPLRERDLEPLVAIENALYEFPWTYGNFRDSLAAGYSCWALWRGGEMAGYAVLMIGPEEAHLLNLSIALPCQRRGYASVLLRHLFGIARSHGAKSVFLEVRPSNVAAHGLYAAFGFSEVGRRKGYYPARPGREDAIVLALPL